MGCVNRSSKEFKDLATRNNVSINALELITHKYWLETGNETVFPTDVYIQAQLGNIEYQEPGSHVRKLWEQKYSSPKEFSNLEDFQSAYDEATRYFPPSALVHYKNAKGNHVLSVTKPVEKVNKNKDKFFERFDDMKSTNGRVLSLGINENQIYGMGKAQELYNKFNTDRTSQHLADKVFSLANALGLTISFNDTLPQGIAGRYISNNSIIYKKSFFENDAMNNLKAPILLHEVLHAVSMYALSDSVSETELSEPLKSFRREINSIYQDLKSSPVLKGERGILNVREFVAELSNPVFRGKIQEIDKANKSKSSFWSKVLSAFKHLLGLHVTNTYYERSMNALDKALGAFDIDTYMRYNGIKHLLRQEEVNTKVSTQLNKSIDVIKYAAISGKWNAEALKELNNLTKDLEDGKVTYQRFPKEASRAYNQGGRANEIASILLGTSESSSTENPRSFSESQRRSQEEKPIQERIIENWAKAEGIWHDNLDYVEGKEMVAEGGEAKVFHNGNEENVTKILSTRYFITPQFALDRITIHNALFPTAPLRVMGFGRNSNGEFQFLVEQPFIQGGHATQEEIDRFITKAGFSKSSKDNAHTFVSDDLYLSDLHDENVIKTPNGDLVVIDADLRLNTPNLNRNGKYEINNNIVSMEDNNAREFIKTLSTAQLDKEKRLIKQESADYNLVNGIEEEHKKSSKAVPQDFTFFDGTTIKAPFRPNEQQVDALNAMAQFIGSDDTSMTLSGYAGTGKTSLMEMIAKKCSKNAKPVMFCATTNKAAAVLNDRVSKAGFKATTLNKTFGINVEIDPNSKSYNARNLVNKLRDVDIMPGTTIIIDEASMINEENYNILNQIAKERNLKIIYVGDEAQLAPVNEDQISKVFRNGDGKVIRLTQVERTDDNAILKEATAIRNGEPLSGVSSFNNKGEGVAYILPQHQDSVNEVIAHYVEGLRNNPNYFRILAYTNKAVSDYNNQVRSLLGYNSPIPHVGEPMTGYANWGYDWKTKGYRFINSESYKVSAIGKPKKDDVMLGNTTVSLQAVPITLTDSMGNTDVFDFVDIKNNPQNRQAATMIANEKKRLWAEAKKAYGKAAKAEIYSRINSLDAYLFVNDNIEDAEHNLLQQKTIDFGYALTVHKSQGSTFTNVLLDDVDISRASLLGSNNAMAAVNLGEDTTHDMTNAEQVGDLNDVDLGDEDLSGAIDGLPSSDSVANVKQQLEYVGVSRATDTVTIISNNVKKEGSPLHPEENIKETSPKSLKDLEEKIQSDSQQMRLSDDEKYYIDEDGNKYARVTSVITTDTDRFDPNSPWALPSSNVGTGVDVFVRDFFDGNIGNPNTLAERYPNANQESLRKLYDSLQEIKDKIKGKFTIISKDVTLHGQIPVIGADGKKQMLPVAGTVDLLIHDDKGNFYIYDMKTHHSNKEIYKDIGKLNKYTKQVSLYKTLFEQMYPGHKVKALALMPIHVSYPAPKGWRDGTAKYSLAGKANQLLIDGKEFKEANPTLEKTIPVTPQKVDIKYEDLTDDVKELIDSNDQRSDNNLYSEDGKSPITIYRGYAMAEDREASTLEETVGHTAVDYDDSLKGAYYFSSSQEEAMDYAKTRTDKSEEEFYRNGELVKQRNRHYTGDFAKVSAYHIAGNAKVEYYRNMRDYVQNGKNSKADVIVLNEGTMWKDNKEYIVKNPNVIILKNNVNTNNLNNGTEYKQTDEFRRVQETVRKGSQGQQRSVLGRNIPRDRRQDLANVLGRQLGSIDSFAYGSSRTITNEKRGSSFNLHSEVDPQLFHDIFEVVRYYTDNGELVDLHDDYTGCKCYLTDDGSAGFAVEPDGNLISVFNLAVKKGFLSAAKDAIIKAGATHLDAYISNNQNLQQIYEKTLGFHTASTMDYNMEYDHDDIAKNHGNPQVVFMVDHEVEEPKHFDKDSYDAAKEYQMQQIEGNETKAETPTFEEGQPQKVSLPSYEYFNDLYDDTMVDAEWKVSYLKELDAQITADNSEEENQSILNKMDNILQATSEKEYLEEIKNSKESKIEKELNEYDRFVKQLDNLLEGGGEDYKELGCTIKATEIRHTAELIVNEISDEITRLQTEEGRAEKIFPTLNSTLDFSTATRKQVVEAVGINNLIDRVKSLFDSENAMYTNIDTSLQADLITDNWDAFITMASDVFAFNEGFGIVKTTEKNKFSTAESSTADTDDFNGYSNDQDISEEEGAKDSQEKWQIDSRTVDPLTSMSALVRRSLHECYLLDEKGNKILSKWGIAERVEPREALNSILRWTQGALSLDNMVTMLREKQPQNPWLSQLITRLSDKSGKETDFQSQFYGVFSKHFQPYSIVLLEDGKYHTMDVNSHPALSDVMKVITAQYKIGEHPMFTGNKVNAKLLGTDSTTGKDVEFNLHKALAELSLLKDRLNHGEVLNEEMTQTATDNIMGVCRLMGYPVTEDMLTDVVNAENIKKEAEFLGYIVSSLDKALSAQGRGELKDYNPFGFGKKNGIEGSLKNFLTPITDKLEDTAVNAFYDSGKMYQSYVIPSFMSKLMKKFQLQGKDFEDFMYDEYASSEWFAWDKFGDFDRLQWRNEWLRLLAKDEKAREIFAHKVELNFNKHNYMRNMTDAEYTLSLITEYFGVSSDSSKSLVPAWFRVPMQSNKPSSDFIRFYSYRGNNYKQSIVRGLHGMFMQELSRIQTVRMRNLSKNDSRFIKNFDSNGKKFCFLPVFNTYLDNSAASILKRQRLHNGVEYDAERLNTLEQKIKVWQDAAKDFNAWKAQYIEQKLQEDALYDELSDPVVKEHMEGVNAEQPSNEEFTELADIRNQKEADERKLSTEEDSRFAALLQKKLGGEVALTSEEEVLLGNLADKIIRQFMENRIQLILDNWDRKGILEAAKTIKDITPSWVKKEDEDSFVREQLENFLWNDAFASKNILQLTIGDIAFYKDTEDLQKRLAQLHAPGIRGNKFATDYKGNRVSDGTYRTVVLKDFDSFMSNIIANISEVFDRRIAAANSEDQKRQLMNLKDSLVRPRTYNEDGTIKDKGGKYWNINVADAQGYSSPSSYRKKAFIFGKWSREAEDIYQKLLKGEYRYDDLQTAFQPLKPFVYTKLTKDLGVDDAPIHSLQVPFQAKNAEYLLIMADALLQGEQLSRPNLLRAVYRVMEDSEKLNPTKGIDTIQFESAIKSGLQGAMDIHQFLEMPNGEEAAYTYMMNNIYKEETDAGGNKVYKNYDTDTFLHEASYDDYCLQQEVPEHFKNHSQAHGSQIRMITPSDLDLYTTDENGNQVDNYYEWKEPDGTVRRLKANEFRKEYEQTIADSIEESINDLAAELHFDSEDKKERNIALSKILIKEIQSSSRYGLDLVLACQVDKETGDFRIPKGDPIQAKRIEQLINSIIKNRINKQKIAGGPIVQVSNFGASKQLHIRFNDKQGNLIPLEKDYVPSEHNGLSYKEYIKKNQGGIAYFEVLAPIWSNELYDKFSNPDGSINVDAIEATDPELLKMVSYRIPTEDKYSCAPMKVVGFMPREAGDAIMFPYELTEIDDSDFDVDKRYVMRKDIPIKRRKRADIESKLFNMTSESYKKAHDGKTANRAIGEEIRMFLDNPQKMKNSSKFQQWLYKQYQYIAYETAAPTSGKQYRDNKVIDMTYAVLTNEMTADKILNPGGFDAPKKMGYMVAAYKNPANNAKWEDLEKMSIDELKDLSYTDKDLTFADTQVQFYKQNAAAASLIGVFAVNKVAHATLEGNGIYLDVSELCGEQPFTIAGTTFSGRMEIDTKYDSNGNLIGKTLGSLVSASADAVKDPILNLMNVNMNTAGMLNTLLRLGMPFDDAALFLSQDIIERLLNQFNRENLSNYVTLDSIIGKWLDAYRKKYNIDDSSNINTEALSKEELVQGLTTDEHEAIDYKVLLAFQKVRELMGAMRKPTFVTRFNSISSAVGPLIIDNLIMEHKMEAFINTGSDDASTNFYSYDEEGGWIPVDIDDILADHPILKQFSRTVDIANAMFRDMPAGSTGFRNLLAKVPKDIADKMFSDKKLLDQFSNFYQSYLLVQSNVVNPQQLVGYVSNFPKWFFEQDFKEKYPNNALIQAIRMNVSNKTKRPYLSINLTGMDESKKEDLRYAWIDLHKENPALSQALFNYSFFRAGVGFSPKTFMALVPSYVKERLKSKDGKTSYVDTYRNFPTVVPDLVIDQFIRNNWDNNKLVPWRGGKDAKYNMDVKHGILTTADASEVNDLKNLSYIKTKSKDVVYLWKFKASDDRSVTFERIMPLGNNGEFLEMSLSQIEKPLAETLQVSENNDTSEIKSTSQQETSSETLATPTISETEKIKNVAALADLIQKQVPKFSKQEALDKVEDIKKRGPKFYAKFLQNVFKQDGLDLNIEQTIKEYEKYC